MLTVLEDAKFNVAAGLNLTSRPRNKQKTPSKRQLIFLPNPDKKKQTRGLSGLSAVLAEVSKTKAASMLQPYTATTLFAQSPTRPFKKPLRTDVLLKLLSDWP
jgi:hypothetical protein